MVDFYKFISCIGIEKFCMIILISSVIITNNIIPYRIGTVNFCFIFICLAHIIFLLMIQFYVVFHLMLKPYVVWDRKQSVAINKNYIKTINAYIYAILYDKNVDVLDFSYNVIPFLKSFLRQYFKIVLDIGIMADDFKNCEHPETWYYYFTWVLVCFMIKCKVHTRQGELK